MQIEENKLIDSIDKQKDIQITAKQNITRFKTEGLQEDRIAAEQNKINEAEKKVKEITKELKKLQKDAKKIESKVKPQIDVLNKLAKDVTNRQQYLKDRRSELQDKISGFAQEQNEYNATDRLLRHTQNNYDIAKNTLKGINSRKLNMMHDIRMQRLATMQSEYMRRFAAKYVGIQNAVLNDNYEDVLYAKINHTNLSQYLDYRAFSQLDEAGKKKVLELIDEILKNNTKESFETLMKDKGIGALKFRFDAIQDILNKTKQVIERVEKSIAEKKPKATTTEEQSIVKELEEFLNVQQKTLDVYTNVQANIQAVIDDNIKELEDYETEISYTKGTSIEATEDSVIEYIDKVLATVKTKNVKGVITLENVPDVDGILALLNAISQLQKSEMSNTILEKLNALTALLDMSTEAIIDKDKLYNAVKTATQNLTAIDDNTLQEYLDEGIKNEFLTAGSIEGIIELVKVLDDVVDGIVNRIGLNTKKYQSASTVVDKINLLENNLKLIKQLDDLSEELQSVLTLEPSFLEEMVQAGIDISNTEDLADLKHAINVLLMPFKRLKDMEQSFKDNLEKLKDAMEHQELDEQLEEIQKQNDNKRTEAILDAFQPLIEQFGLEFNNETKLFEFTNEILSEELVTKLQEINNRLNSIDYSKSVWLNTVNEVIAEINTMGLGKLEATEVAKFILNKIINHKDSDLIYKSIVPVVEVFTPSNTVTNQTIKVPISSPILHRLNRNGLVYENARISETAFADLSEVVNGIRVLMNQNNNKVTFVKERIVYPGNKGARVYTTFVIPSTNFSLPSLENTKIVKNVLAHENADEMLRKIKEFVDNVAYTLTPEQAMEIYHEIMKDEAFKTSFEKHFTSPADNAKKRIEQITKTIKSYEKRLENMSDIREDLLNHQTIIDLYENNEKEITLTFENNVELVTIPIKTSTSNVGFNAPSTSRVTMNKFNNDATNENKLENHFKLAIPKQTSSGKQYTSNGVDVTLNSEQNGLVLIPLSENSVFDANKPFGGNEYISLQSIQFPIELGNEIYSKLKALKEAKTPEEIETINDEIALYFANTTSGDKSYTHNKDLKFIKISLKSNGVAQDVTIKYGDKLEIVNIGKSKKISNNSTNLNKALSTNNNVITFSKNGENHRVEVIIKDGKISYKHNNSTTKKTQTVDKASIETLMTGVATFNNYDRKVLNSNEFVNLLKGAYIDFNFAKIKELEAKGENVLNRIAPYVLLNKGVITVDGKVTETLIPKRLVDNKAQEVYIEMPRYGETNTRATSNTPFSDRGETTVPAPAPTTKTKQTYRRISNRAIDRRINDARIIYLHDDIELNDNFLIHTGDALELEQLKVQTIKENKIVVTKMRDKADIVFVSDKSILNTEFAGYNNIYTGDSKSILDKRFEKKEDVSDKEATSEKETKDIQEKQLDLFENIEEEEVQEIKTYEEIITELYNKSEQGQISLAGEDYTTISNARNNPTKENIEALMKLYNEIINQQTKDLEKELSQDSTVIIGSESKIQSIIDQFDVPLSEMSKEELQIAFDDYGVKLQDRVEIEQLWEQEQNKQEEEDLEQKEETTEQQTEETTEQQTEEELEEFLEETLEEHTDEIEAIAEEEGTTTEEVIEQVKQEVKNTLNGNKSNKTFSVKFKALLTKVLKAVLGVYLIFNMNYLSNGASNVKIIETNDNKYVTELVNRIELKEMPAAVTDEAQIAYLEYNKKGESFIIVDKVLAKALVFDNNGKFVKEFPVLTGRDIGDNINNVDGETGIGNATTPALKSTLEDNNFNPEDLKLYKHKILAIANSDALALHITYPNELISRTNALESETTKDNRRSMGCINISEENWDSISSTIKDGSHIIITSEQATPANIHNQVSDGATEINQELAQKLQDRMQELYPMLDINFTNTIGVDNNGQQIIGQANIEAMTVLIDAINQKQDTLPHEYAHHYIAWFRNTPIVQEAIKKWGSEEALVQSIGEQVVKQEGEAKTWWDNFTKWMLDLFNNLSSKNKQELTQILTDTFLQGIDLETGQKITAERSKEKVQVKEGVKELFESNLELANEIYEALGLNIIDGSEITYTDEEGNPCAKMGLTNTVKGTDWKIVKDFKGKPKHSNGGVDITISDKGVTMRRGGIDIKAKYGLLIINNN